MIKQYDRDRLIKLIDNMTKSANSTLLSLQSSRVPSFKDLKLNIIEDGVYYIKGDKYVTTNPLLKVTEPDMLKTTRFNLVGTERMDTLVSNGMISPMILYIDNSMIRMSSINIISDDRTIYLELLDIDKYRVRLGNEDIFTTLPTHYSILLPKIPKSMRSRVKLSIIIEQSIYVSDIKLNSVSLDINRVDFNKIECTMEDLPENVSLRGNKFEIISSQDIRVKTITLEYIGDKVIDLDNITTMFLNNDIVYNENRNTISSDDRMIFFNGMAIESVSSYILPITVTAIKFKSSDLHYENIIPIKSRFRVNVDTAEKVYRENVLTYINGYLGEARLSNRSNNIFEIEGYSTSLKYVAKVFYYKSNSTSKDNITRLQEYIDVSNMLINNQTLPSYVWELMSPLRLSYDKNKSYDENLDYIIKEIGKYNVLLLKDYFDTANNVYSEVYNYTEIVDMIQQDSNNKYLYISKLLEGDYSTEVMCFYNNSIHSGVVSKFDYIRINFTLDHSFIEGDIIELIFFKKVCNSISETVFDNESKTINLKNFLGNVNDLRIFSSHADSPDIIVSEDIKFNVDYTSSTVDDNTTITLDEIYYIGKPLNLVSRRQFRHHTCYGLNKADIILDPIFKYCRESDQYMIFINGRLIDRDRYTITYNAINTPFDKVYLYFSFNVMDTDRIDIFYVPHRIDMYRSGLTLDKSGIFDLDRRTFLHMFLQNSNFVFINGRKVSRDDIRNLSGDKVQITCPLESTNNLSILRAYSDEDRIYSVLYYLLNTSPIDASLEYTYPDDYDQTEVNLILRKTAMVDGSVEYVDPNESGSFILSNVVEDQLIDANIQQLYIDNQYDNENIIIDKSINVFPVDASQNYDFPGDDISSQVFTLDDVWSRVINNLQKEQMAVFANLSIIDGELVNPSILDIEESLYKNALSRIQMSYMVLLDFYGNNNVIDATIMYPFNLDPQLIIQISGINCVPLDASLEVTNL